MPSISVSNERTSSRVKTTGRCALRLLLANSTPLQRPFQHLLEEKTTAFKATLWVLAATFLSTTR
jgi:hypothetical protein